MNCIHVLVTLVCVYVPFISVCMCQNPLVHFDSSCSSVCHYAIIRSVPGSEPDTPPGKGGVLTVIGHPGVCYNVLIRARVVLYKSLSTCTL